MHMKQALARIRKLGYSTIKNCGTWYISKPYTNASYLITINDVIMVALQDNGMTSYINIEELERLESIAV